jgi:hypothetical protein
MSAPDHSEPFSTILLLEQQTLYFRLNSLNKANLGASVRDAVYRRIANGSVHI